jgi:hypothetical protein
MQLKSYYASAYTGPGNKTKVAKPISARSAFGAASILSGPSRNGDRPTGPNLELRRAANIGQRIYVKEI